MGHPHDQMRATQLGQPCARRHVARIGSWFLRVLLVSWEPAALHGNHHERNYTLMRAAGME